MAGGRVKRVLALPFLRAERLAQGAGALRSRNHPRRMLMDPASQCPIGSIQRLLGERSWPEHGSRRTGYVGNDGREGRAGVLADTVGDHNDVGDLILDRRAGHPCDGSGCVEQVGNNRRQRSAIEVVPIHGEAFE